MFGMTPECHNFHVFVYSLTSLELKIFVSDYRFDVVEIICGLLKSLKPSVNGAVMTSMAVNILTKMLKW